MPIVSINYKYLSSNDVSNMLSVTLETARKIMRGAGCIQIGKGKKSIIRVSTENLNNYLDLHTIPPGTVIPRPTPYETADQKEKRELREWHKKRRDSRS